MPESGSVTIHAPELLFQLLFHPVIRTTWLPPGHRLLVAETGPSQTIVRLTVSPSWAYVPRNDVGREKCPIRHRGAPVNDGRNWGFVQTRNVPDLM